MFFLRFFSNTSEYQQAESSMDSKRPSVGYTDDNEQFHWFPYVRTLSITAMSLSDFGTVSGGSGHWSQKMETEDAAYAGELVIEGSNLDLISALTIGHTGCTVTTSVKSRKRNRKVYNVEIIPTDVSQTNNCYVTFSYGNYSLSNEYDFVVPSFDDKYLTFVPVNASTFTFSGTSIDYSIDDGATWTTLASNTATPTVPAGNKIMWKNTRISAGGRFSSSNLFDAYGNPMSIISGDSFVGVESVNLDNLFDSLFSGCTTLRSASGITMPFTSMTAAYGYRSMFNSCTSLIDLPYIGFGGIVYDSHSYMFSGCTSIVDASNMELTGGNYGYMFAGCTSLQTSPIIKSSFGYYRDRRGTGDGMFQGCSSLNYITYLGDNLAGASATRAVATTACSTSWVSGVASSGTFVKKRGATYSNTFFAYPCGSKCGNHCVPCNWTIVEVDVE